VFRAVLTRGEGARAGRVAVAARLVRVNQSIKGFHNKKPHAGRRAQTREKPHITHLPAPPPQGAARATQNLPCIMGGSASPYYPYMPLCRVALCVFDSSYSGRLTLARLALSPPSWAPSQSLRRRFATRVLPPRCVVAPTHHSLFSRARVWLVKDYFVID